MMNAMYHTPQKNDDLNPVMEELTHSALGKIIQKARWLMAIDRELQNILPAAFAPYCHVMNVDQSILILGVNNAAIATRIKFISADLIRELHKQTEFVRIQIIHCKVCANTIKY